MVFNGFLSHAAVYNGNIMARTMSGMKAWHKGLSTAPIGLVVWWQGKVIQWEANKGESNVLLF